MHDTHAAYAARSNIYIGYLEGHANNEGKINKIQVVGLLSAWKLQATNSFGFPVSIHIRIVV